MDIRHGPVEAVLTGHTFEISVEPPGPLVLSCSAGEDRWRVERPAAGQHQVAWYGLLLGSWYTCRARSGATVRDFGVSTPDPPADLPQLTVSGEAQGYTLINHVRDGVGQKLILFDNRSGLARWVHYLRGDPNVGIEAAIVDDSPYGQVVLAGGGEGYHPTLLGLDGLERWQMPDPLSGRVYHHEAVWRADLGAALGLAWEDNRAGARLWDGFSLELWQVEPTERQWTFSSQAAVDRAELPLPPLGEDDAYHPNAVAWVPEDPDGPAWWVSLKTLHQVARVDAVTGAVGWRVGLGGDFRLLDAAGSPLGDEHWFYGQHAPEPRWIGGDRFELLIHDNGMERPLGAWSRALRLVLDLGDRTATLDWEWREDNWYEPVFGDVDRLSDGQVVITRAHCPQCAAATARPGGLVQVDPSTDRVLWRADFPSLGDSSYRSHRVPPCQVFPDHVSVCEP